MSLFGTPKNGTVTFTPGEKTYVLTQKNIGANMPIEWLNKTISSLSSYENACIFLSAYTESSGLNIRITDNAPCYASTKKSFDDCGEWTGEDTFYISRLDFAKALYTCFNEDKYKWSQWGTYFEDTVLDDDESTKESKKQQHNYNAFIEKLCVLRRLIEKKEGINIPKSFYAYDSGIITFKIQEGTEVIQKQAFAFCQNLETVMLPESLKRIDDRAFSHCKNLKRIILMQNTEYIDSFAFSYCENLQEVFISKSVSEIGIGAFAGSKNVLFSVDEQNPYFKTSSDGTLLLSKDGKILYSGRLNRKNHNTCVQIPNGVEVVFDSAFFSQDDIRSVIFPPSLKELQDDAFGGIEHLKKAEFTSLEPPKISDEDFHKTFEDAEDLETILVPDCALEKYYESRDWDLWRWDLISEKGRKLDYDTPWDIELMS